MLVYLQIINPNKNYLQQNNINDEKNQRLQQQ